MRLAWTNEEIEYLKEEAGFVKVSTIAKNLGRTYESVSLKMKRLDLFRTKSLLGMVTMHELSKIVGVDRKTVEGWVTRHGLPCMKRVTKEKRTFSLISPEDFWKWAENNKEKVQFNNIEPHILPPEPSWVSQERKREMEHSLKKKRTYQTWSTKEDLRLLELREEGLTYKKIGEIMNRSVNSVERRYKRIQEKV